MTRNEQEGYKVKYEHDKMSEWAMMRMINRFGIRGRCWYKGYVVAMALCCIVRFFLVFHSAKVGMRRTRVGECKISSAAPTLPPASLHAEDAHPNAHHRSGEMMANRVILVRCVQQAQQLVSFPSKSDNTNASSSFIS
jgi:hypothetical protein